MLKETPTNRHLLRGFGPLFVGVILFVLMVLLAPTVAGAGTRRHHRGTRSGTRPDHVDRQLTWPT